MVYFQILKWTGSGTSLPKPTLSTSQGATLNSANTLNLRNTFRKQQVGILATVRGNHPTLAKLTVIYTRK